MMITAVTLCLIQVTIVATAGSLLATACRRRPAARSAVLVTALVAVGAVTLIAFCPLPEWWRVLPTESTVASGTTDTIAAPVDHQASSIAENSQRQAKPDPSQVGSEFSISIRRLVQSLIAAQNDKTAVSSSWIDHFLKLIALGISICMVRIAFGLRSIRRYCRQSQRPTNAKVYSVLEKLQQHGASQHIEVRESSQIVSAATMGWLRPMIILPNGWTEWSDDELMAVLAHEVAHVRRRDYPLRLAAYVISALHFYHPLIHWLTSCLVQQQELAADTIAATLVGDRRRYLRALSKLALRQDDRPHVWSASIALPVSSSFLIRRIEMLRAKEGSVSGRESTTKRIQWISVAVLAAIAIGATALRGTAQQPDAVRVAKRIVRKSDERKKLQRKPFNASLIAEKGSAVVVLRVAELMRRPGMQAYRAYEKPLQKMFKSTFGDDSKLLLKPAIRPPSDSNRPAR